MKKDQVHGLLLDWRLASVSLLALVVLVYLPVFSAGFIWDDDDYIEKNQTLRSPAGLQRIWLDMRSTPQYYPLVFTTFWVEYHLWGLDPHGYHVVNVLLHGLNALLLFLVLRQLSVPGAWLAAALFALHPVHVESVAWVTERKNVLSMFFYGLSLLAWFRFSPPQPNLPRGSWLWYLVSLLLFYGALSSKTITCSLPAVLVLLLWWKHGRVPLREGLALVPMFILGLTLGLVTAWLEKEHVGAVGKDWSLTPLERILIAGRALCFYTSKLLWPAELIFIYPRWEVDARVWWQYLFPLTAGMVILALWLARPRLGRGPLVAVLIFAGTLVPALGFFDVFPMRYSFVADHFQYLASASLLALFAACLATWVQRRPGEWKWFVVAGGVLLVLLAGLTWRQQSIYQNLRTLWTNTIQRNPHCWLAAQNLGCLCLAEQDWREAKEWFDIMMRFRSHTFEPHANLGAVFAAQGKLNDASRHFATAIEIDPKQARVHSSYAAVLARQGKWRQARERYLDSLRLAPTNWSVHSELGLLLARESPGTEAVEHLMEASRLNPTQSITYYQLGMLLARLGRKQEAVVALTQAVTLEPNSTTYRIWLSVHLQRIGKTEAAFQELQTAIHRDPLWPVAANRVAWTLATNPDAELRDGQAALTLATAVCRWTGNQVPRFLDTLAAARAEAGQFAQAVELAQRALQFAKGDGEKVLAWQIEKRIETYKKQQPFRQPRVGPS